MMNFLSESPMTEKFSESNTDDSVTFDSEFCTSCGCIINTTLPELPTECVACKHPIDAKGKYCYQIIYLI